MSINLRGRLARLEEVVARKDRQRRRVFTNEERVIEVRKRLAAAASEHGLLDEHGNVADLEALAATDQIAALVLRAHQRRAAHPQQQHQEQA